MPLSTISAQSASYSSREPSTQWMASGCVSRAIFSTHLRRWPFLLRGIDGSRPFPAGPASFSSDAGCRGELSCCYPFLLRIDFESLPISFRRGSKSAVIRAMLARSVSEANYNPRLRFGLV